MRKKVNWILDADIPSFFDEIRHDWLLKFVKHRIADRRILRLIGKWLRAGVSEEGQWSATGTYHRTMRQVPICRLLSRNLTDTTYSVPLSPARNLSSDRASLNATELGLTGRGYRSA
jgi:retron-type reverse transcriptase